MEFIWYCLACYFVAFALHHRKRIMEYIRKEASFPPEPIIRNPIPGSYEALTYENRIAAMHHWISRGERYLTKEDLENRLGACLSEAEVLAYRNMARGGNDNLAYDAFDPGIPHGDQTAIVRGGVGAVGIDITRQHHLYARMFGGFHDEDPYGDFGYRGRGIDPDHTATKSLIDQLEASK